MIEGLKERKEKSGSKNFTWFGLTVEDPWHYILTIEIVFIMN